MFNSVTTFKRVLASFLAVILVGCAGQAKFKPTEKVAGYNKAIESRLLVVFETSHLIKAFSEGRFPVQGSSGNTPQDAAKAVVAQLQTELQPYSVQLDSEVIDASVGNDRLAISKAVAKYPATQQILIITSNSFESTQLMRYGQPIGSKTWSGRVSWSLSMFDNSAFDITAGKAAWSGKTEMVIFSPTQCGKDQFKLCADRFVSNIVYQLRTDGLIRKV
jgi:hypothetical protein